MFGFERKVEMVDESNAIINRRFVTPFFYIGLKPKTAVFHVRQSECDVFFGYLSLIPFAFPIKKPGHFHEVGFWEGYLCDELKSVRNSYERWVKA